MASNTASRILRSTSSPFAASTPPRQCLRITPLSRPATSCPFSTSSSLQRDNNRRRGHSAIRAKGKPQRFQLISASKLPKPFLNRPELTTPTTNHGLMGFFNKKGTLLSEPSDDAEHGRRRDTCLDKKDAKLTIGYRQRLDRGGTFVEDMGRDALSMVGMYEREEQISDREGGTREAQAWLWSI